MAVAGSVAPFWASVAELLVMIIPHAVSPLLQLRNTLFMPYIPGVRWALSGSVFPMAAFELCGCLVPVATPLDDRL